MLMLLCPFGDVGKNPAQLAQLMLMMLGRFWRLCENPDQVMFRMLGRFRDVGKTQPS